ncbi:MAG: hypothetical protein WKF96_14100 [Solirubrobacteraceae bacterium]
MGKGKGDELLRSSVTAGSWPTPCTSPATPTPTAASCRARGASWGSPRRCHVETRSGWFSDRTQCYLAGGRPALVRETGFRALAEEHFAADRVLPALLEVAGAA